MLRYRLTRARIFFAVAASVAAGAVMACGSDNFSTNESNDASTSSDTSSIDGDSDSTTIRDGAIADAIEEPAPKGFCHSFTPSPFFCADFDETDPLQTYVNGTSSDGGVMGLGGAVVEKPGGLSAPNVLSSSVPSSVGPGTATFNAALPDAPTATHLRLELDLRIDTPGDISSTQVETFLSLVVSNSGGTVTIPCGLAFHAGAVVASVGAVNIDMGAPSDPGASVHAVLDLQLKDNTFTATFNGTTNSLSATLANQTHATVNVGLVAPSFGVGTSVSFDNVTLVADKGDAG